LKTTPDFLVRSWTRAYTGDRSAGDIGEAYAEHPIDIQHLEALANGRRDVPDTIRIVFRRHTVRSPMLAVDVHR
jgi:hypothetical protein